MRKKKGAGVKLLVVALPVLCVLNAFPLLKMARGENEPQTAAQTWLSWSAETRAGYVWGFLSGFEQGKRAGCSFYEEKTAPPVRAPLPPEKFPGQICMKDLPQFSQPYYHVYVDAITEYYSKYPTDREAGISQIMSELTSPPSLTVEQIHEKLNGRPRN